MSGPAARSPPRVPATTPRAAGSTQLNGTLTAGGGQANFNGGVLFGNGGTINGNVMMAGTIVPAATINGMNMPLTAGALHITGNYTQTAAGIFNLGLGGLSPGTQFGFLGITGNANLDGTLNVSLINGFFPTVGNSFTFLTTGGSVSNEFSTVNGLNIGDGLQLDVIYGSNFVELTTMALTNTDLWLGGTGVWSNGAKWSIGVPTPPDNVFIYSGGTDMVTLDTGGSNNVNSLTVGGATKWIPIRAYRWQRRPDPHHCERADRRPAGHSGFRRQRQQHHGGHGNE